MASRMAQPLRKFRSARELSVLGADDCATTAAPGQQGTYQYSRAGWCPGAMVEPWIEAVDTHTEPSFQQSALLILLRWPRASQTPK